ncbi:MAG: FCD domain-containing protein [Thermodesulfobacteriota bacterium]
MKSKKINTLSSGPVNELKYLERFRSLLSGRPRDLLFFELATRTGLPASYLLNLKVKDLALNESEVYLKANMEDNIISRPLVIDEPFRNTLKGYLTEIRASEDDYLFPSRKGGGPLTIASASRMVRGWFKQLKVKSPGGLLSLRRAYLLHYHSPRPSGREARPEAASKPLLRPLKSTPLQEMVLDELQRAILSGRILPGEKIMAEDIARQMGVSRTPVREALSRLQASGFVYPQKGGGSVVTHLSEKEIEEIVEVRLLLEITIARQAAGIESEETCAKLEQQIAKMKSASEKGNVDDYLKANQEFHHTIYRSVQRPFLRQLIETVWHRLSPYLYIEIRRKDEFDWTGDITRHRLMLEALKRRDTEELCHWLSEDIKEVARMVKVAFDQNKLTA